MALCLRSFVKEKMRGARTFFQAVFVILQKEAQVAVGPLRDGAGSHMF